MISRKEKAMGIIVILSFLAGISVQMIYGNIEYNSNLEKKINTLVDSGDPRFRIGNDIFRIERVNNSLFEEYINDTIIRTP